LYIINLNQKNMPNMPDDFEEKMRFIQRNREIKEQSRMNQMKKQQEQELARQRHMENTMNYMGGGKVNKKNSKNY